MKKEIAIELNEFAAELALRYSRTDREGNSNKETFHVQEVIPTSDHTAVVRFKKNTGKVGLGFLLLYKQRNVQRVEVFLSH